MPVQTRSQILIQQNNDLINETPERVSCGNGKYRKVLSTPLKPEEPSKTLNPPPIAKKTKSTGSKPKGKVCRRIDFEEADKPETYRCFEISSRTMRGKVDEFYKMCDDYHNEQTKKGSMKKSDVRSNTEQLNGFSTEYLVSLARSLLAYDLFTQFYKKDPPKEELNILIETWGTMLTSIYSICFMRMFNKSQTSNSFENIKIISDEVVPFVILFQPIISSDRFSGFGYCRKLFGVIIKKLVEFSDKGVVQAVVAIHKFFPDMVSKDCYPSLNPEKNKDTINCTECLLEKSADSTMKIDWMNLKQIYNKK
jgi:hypothetical protein